MLKESTFKDKVVVVTGGSRGIGRAISQLFAELGGKVFFTYHSNKEEALAWQTEAAAQGHSITAMPLDVRKQDACQTLIEDVYNSAQRIDILVNNSGITRDSLLLTLEEDDIRNVLDTNLLGAFYMTKAVIPYMMRNRAGKIINISSVSAEKGGRGQSNYAASKGAINAFTKAMAVELASKKITVNAVAPGVIETEMSKEIRHLANDEILSKILLKRYGQAVEIAYAVGFLASPFADYITGEILHVDGGFKMS